MKKSFAIILSIIMLFTSLSPVFGAQTDSAGQSEYYVLKDGMNTYTGVTFWLDADGEYYVSTATKYENRKDNAVYSSSGKAAPGVKWDSGKWVLTNISITRDDIFPLHVYSSNVTTVIEYDGSVIASDDYASVQSEGYEKAYIDLYKKTEIEGSKYSFRVSQQSDNVISGYEKGLSSISGKATADTTFEETEKGIKATSANKLTNVQTSSHIGNTYYTRKESDSTTIEVSSEDKKGDKEGSDEILPDSGSDDDNTTGRPKDTYYVGEKTDAHARYFKSIDKLGVKAKYKIADSDKKLASINGKGIFKGKKPGKVTIEVYIKEHGKFILWDHVKVTVIPKPVIKFTDKFTTITSEIDVWKYVTPDGAKVYPPEKWESSNEAVAVIDKTGKIKVKGPGSTKLTGYFGSLKVNATLKIKPFKRKKDNC